MCIQRNEPPGGCIAAWPSRWGTDFVWVWGQVVEMIVKFVVIDCHQREPLTFTIKTDHLSGGEEEVMVQIKQVNT